MRKRVNGSDAPTWSPARSQSARRFKKLFGRGDRLGADTTKTHQFADQLGEAIDWYIGWAKRKIQKANAPELERRELPDQTRGQSAPNYRRAVTGAPFACSPASLEDSVQPSTQYSIGGSKK